TRAREGDGRLAHARPQRLRYDGRGGLLDDLLVAALQRALALAEVHDVAVAVAEDLHFDVARALDPLLDDDAVVTERGPRFALRSRGGLLQLRGGADDAHARAAATGDRLDDNRIASVLARRNHG